MPDDLTIPLQAYIEKVCCIRMKALEDRIEAHRREHELLSEALGKAEAAVNQRLGAMNKLRDQINTERGAYATKDAMRATIDALSNKVDLAQNAIANMEGRAWALTIAIPLMVSALVSLAIKFL